jgi:ribosomal-protein-alanine N-acetyltransferase
MVIRDVTQHDAALLAELHAQSFQQSWSEFEFENLISYNTVCGFLAYKNTSPVGFILAQVAVDQADILTFCVIPSYQKRGIGRLLVNQLKDFLTTTQVNKITLEVACDNQAAHQLYTHVGFIPVGIRKNYYNSHQGASTDAITMVWKNDPKTLSPFP